MAFPVEHWVPKRIRIVAALGYSPVDSVLSHLYLEEMKTRGSISIQLKENFSQAHLRCLLPHLEFACYSPHHSGQPRNVTALIRSTERFIHPVHKGTGGLVKKKALWTNAALPISQRLLSPGADQVSKILQLVPSELVRKEFSARAPCMYKCCFKNSFLLSLKPFIAFPQRRE